jgi:hypothetical protein
MDLGVSVKPLVRLGLTFAIVWFYHALLGSFLAGWPRTLAVVALAVPTWIVVSRMLFPADDDGLLDDLDVGRRGRD